ncbi:YqhG family protein [Bacillus sp. FJAT-49732]|uniref:YqhG family protein n=1 Tax=Lederbergia citrisecunda TaxID=2833583 RepID=A0A942TMU9_9BACI|nr:YqhG family protein [Lederbergia citrisecunda]MBS4199651.1 YqhG family protein [Lederbergia citrisecunda]
MLQKEIHQYLETFFTENDCLIEDNGPGHLTIQLTIDMDKELMNRPFYWTYLEKTGGIPNPMKITFITDQEKTPEHLKGEIIHFGAPRLHQIFNATKKLSAYIRLYEIPSKADSTRQIPLHPWLMLNIKLSYRCDRKKDLIKSIGLNLINGSLFEDFYEKVEAIQLQPTIPDYCFTISPIIKPISGLKRIENHLSNEVTREEHHWADEAIKRWSEDLQLLDHFYEDHSEKPETYEVEKEALKDQYEPVVHMEIINGGLYYLATHPYSN